MEKQLHITEDHRMYLPFVQQTNAAMIQVLQKHYEDLVFEVSNDDHFVLFLEKLNEASRGDLILDVEFYYRNPNLPLENLCSRLNNYRPQNSSQANLLMHAQTLVDLKEPHIAAGLFIHGSPGIGKTHIAVGTAKEFMRRGIHPNYINVQPRYVNSYRSVISEDNIHHFVADQAWIIDDLNSPFSTAMKIFKVVVMNAHNYGGRVFVTSNVSYNYLIENGFVSDPGEKMRFIDRVKGMFAVLQIDGDSQRAKTAWYNKK